MTGPENFPVEILTGYGNKSVSFRGEIADAMLDRAMSASRIRHTFEPQARSQAGLRVPDRLHVQVRRIR